MNFTYAVLGETFQPHGVFIPYTFANDGIQHGKVRYYWLQLEYMDGTTELYGPTSVGYLFKVYLPVNLSGVPDSYPY